MADERCPFCGVELRGSNGNLFCPNHGIIKQGARSEDKESPSYCG